MLPQEQFTGLATVYDKSRPDYPQAVLPFLESRCGLHGNSLVVDIGSGTGISSRWLAQRGWRVLGIEPNDDMRRQAETISTEGITYRQGTGEATGLPDECADLILCAQAFHWLDPKLALPEFRRLLKPGGWIALLWNERDGADPFTTDFGHIIRRNRQSVRMEYARQRAWQTFMADEAFDDRQRNEFVHEQAMDRDGLFGRALSMSHTPKQGPAHDDLLASLKECFERWQSSGVVVMRYITSVFTGRRPLTGPARLEG